jgi:hypothetical protein
MTLAPEEVLPQCRAPLSDSVKTAAHCVVCVSCEQVNNKSRDTVDNFIRMHVRE